MLAIFTPEMLAAMAAVMVAGFVRGWSGFGFALVSGVGLTFLFPPQLFVPVVLMIELALGLQLVPREMPHCSWSTVRPMLVGAILGTMAGLALLQGLPVALGQASLGLAVGGSALAMLMAPQRRIGPGRPVSLAAGALSGLMNGAFAMGGPPAVLFLSGRLDAAHQLRASIILYFFVVDIVALALLGVSDGLSRQSLWQAVILLPASLVGVEIGRRTYGLVHPDRFRPILLAGLVFIGISLTLRGAIAVFMSRS